MKRQELLPLLFQQVVTPPEVRFEFERAARAYLRFAGLAFPTWIREQPALVIPDAIRNAPLDAGEIAAIALALETAADAVLIDETAGRRVARQLGLTAIGVAGVLVRARLAGLLPSIEPVLQELEQKANFWLAPGIRAEALRAAGEEP